MRRAHLHVLHDDTRHAAAIGYVDAVCRNAFNSRAGSSDRSRL